MRCDLHLWMKCEQEYLFKIYSSWTLSSFWELSACLEGEGDHFCSMTCASRQRRRREPNELFSPKRFLPIRDDCGHVHWDWHKALRSILNISPMTSSGATAFWHIWAVCCHSDIGNGDFNTPVAMFTSCRKYKCHTCRMCSADEASALNCLHFTTASSSAVESWVVHNRCWENQGCQRMRLVHLNPVCPVLLSCYRRLNGRKMIQFTDRENTLGIVSWLQNSTQNVLKWTHHLNIY